MSIIDRILTYLDSPKTPHHKPLGVYPNKETRTREIAKERVSLKLI